MDVLKKNSEIQNIGEASDLPNVKGLSNVVTKQFVCYPKEIVSVLK